MGVVSGSCPAVRSAWWTTHTATSLDSSGGSSLSLRCSCGGTPISGGATRAVSARSRGSTRSTRPGSRLGAHRTGPRCSRSMTCRTPRTRSSIFPASATTAPAASRPSPSLVRASASRCRPRSMPRACSGPGRSRPASCRQTSDSLRSRPTRSSRGGLRSAPALGRRTEPSCSTAGPSSSSSRSRPSKHSSLSLGPSRCPRSRVCSASRRTCSWTPRSRRRGERASSSSRSVGWSTPCGRGCLGWSSGSPASSSLSRCMPAGPLRACCVVTPPSGRRSIRRSGGLAC